MRVIDKADVLIVGGGIVGAMTAYALGRRRRRVTLIDAKFPGWGASGRNGGFVWTHMRARGPQLALGLAGRKIYDDLVSEIDDFDFRPSGGMTFFFDAQAKLFEELVEERKGAGLPMSLLSPAEARQLAPILPDGTAGAMFNSADAYINPPRLIQALATAAERAGATIVSGVKAVGLEASGNTVRGVRTAEGTYGAEVVVLAAGTWAAELVQPLGITLPITPERMQTIELGRSEIRFGPPIYGPLAAKLYKCARALPSYSDDLVTHPLERVNPGVEFLEGFAQRRDGRVMIGWPCDQPGFDDRTTMAGLAMTLGIFHDHVPALKSLPVERSWACILPTTPDALPILGRVDGIDGLVLGAGHSFGNSGGPISGKLLAQLIEGETPEMDLEPFRYGRPGLAARKDGEPLRY
ncbi:MAG: NAD(P)/FAD-dependent oxidoreductase [Alphaproteobacteria bacterium]